MSTAEKNLSGLKENETFAKTNDPNYRFVNFFNMKEATKYDIGAINDTKKINFSSTLAIPGNQTMESCKMNAATLYNQINTIDYSAASNYKADRLELTIIDGRMDEQGLLDPDYFINKNAETADYDLKALTLPAADTNSDYNMSVELFGYISVGTSGNYTINIKPEYVNSIAVAIGWLKNNAETSYRITNSTFNTKEKQNIPVYLAKWVFIPIRIQLIATAGIAEFPFIITDGKNTDVKYYSLSGDKKKKQVVFSLTKNIDKTQSCNIYTEGNIENYGIDKTYWETGKETKNVEIKEVKRWNLDPTADSVGLGINGDLVSFVGEMQIGNPIILSNYPASNPNANSTYQMILQDNVSDIIRLVRINRFRNKNTTNTSSTKTSVSITGLTRNAGWNAFNTNSLNVFDSITATTPLVSTRKMFMLALVKDQTTTSLVLYAATNAATTFYGLDVDTKLGKTFYANKNVAKEYLREVPSELTSYSSNSKYTTYGNYYPQTKGNYTVGATQECRKECNSDPNCTHVYNVKDATGKAQCLLSSGSVTYAPKQVDSPFTDSTLFVRGKTIDINKMADKSFQNIKYEMGSITGFNNYTIHLPLTKDSIAGTKGENEYIKLQNQISASTSSQIPLVKPDSNNKGAGMIEGFRGLFSSNLEGFTYTSATPGSGTTVLQNISGQLLGVQNQISDYVTLQKKIGATSIDISNNISGINVRYTELSDNDKYDFTTREIKALDEDYSLGPALLKDNAIFLEEQSNLKIVGTITLATLLISAIFISK